MAVRTWFLERMKTLVDLSYLFNTTSSCGVGVFFLLYRLHFSLFNKIEPFLLEMLIDPCYEPCSFVPFAQKSFPSVCATTLDGSFWYWYFYPLSKWPVTKWFHHKYCWKSLPLVFYLKEYAKLIKNFKNFLSVSTNKLLKINFIENKFLHECVYVCFWNTVFEIQ